MENLTEIKSAEVTSLEHSTLKVPYEVLNKKFRLAQKSLDREVYHVTNAVSELEKVLTESKNPSQISSLLGGVMEKLSSFKRKAEEVTQDERDCGRVIKRRVEHLKEHSSTSPAKLCQWKQMRLDRLLAEYLLRAGYYKTASELVRSSDIEGLTNLDIFLVANDVEKSLQDHDTSRCLAWCYENKSKLRKLNSTLEFNIRVQEFIEFIKQDRRMDAVWHARKHFTGQDQSQMQAVQQCMALLAFPVDTDVSPYRELFAPSRWDRLVEQFRDENLNLFQISTPSAFSVALQAGLSALKTPQCYGSSAKHNCPVCQKNLNALAASLPYAQSSHSRLVCHISGEQMNEHNQPLMLPNGYVYGQKALEQMASENDGFVLCPRSHQTFTLIEADKVYVM